jgi:cytochrome c oxidase subunit 2
VSQKRILIVSQYSLFDQGLRSALSHQPEVKVVGVCRDLEEAHAQAQALQPDVLLLIAGPEVVRDSAFRLLEEVSPSIIRISPSDGTMQVYHREQVDEASLDDLMAAIEATANQLKAGQPKERASQQISSSAGSFPTQPRRASMKHLIIVAVLVVVATVLVSIGLEFLPILPQGAGQEAVTVDWLFKLELRVIAFLFSLIVVFTLYSVVVFRRKTGETDDGPHIHGNTKLEIIWTVIPLITVLFFGVLGARGLSDITSPAPDELIVEVTARQFAWLFDYPEYGITSSSELHLPRGRQVLLKLNSVDVIHDFWVPELRVKQDAVPGMTTELRITPTELGEFKVRCAELCGTAHYSMLAPVKVEEPADFEAWITANTAPPPDTTETVPSEGPAEPAPSEAPGVELGATLAQAQGCLGCHSIDGSQLVGPTWLGLYGSQVILEDDTSAVADEGYLRRAILETNAEIVKGYPANIMPSIYLDTLTEEQIDTLIEYIKSLAE